MSDSTKTEGYILLVPQEGSEMYPAYAEGQNLTALKSEAEFRRKMYVATGQMPETTVIARVTWERKGE